MVSLRLWAVGKLAGNVFVILIQDWEYLPDGSKQPIWTRADGRFFTDLRVARKYLQSANGLANPTSDSVIGGVVDAELAISPDVGEYFAKVSPAHEYLVRA